MCAEIRFPIVLTLITFINPFPFPVFFSKVYILHTSIKLTYGYGGIINDGTKEHEIMGSGANPEMASMRNVAGEIEGAMAAISYAEQNGIQELTIYYDYIGIENWPTGKWNANQKGTQLYRDYVRNAKIKIYFKKVKGHSGVRGNEKADMLAKRAVGVV